jgi:hypothetical protein
MPMPDSRLTNQTGDLILHCTINARKGDLAPTWQKSFSHSHSSDDLAHFELHLIPHPAAQVRVRTCAGNFFCLVVPLVHKLCKRSQRVLARA